MPIILNGTGTISGLTAGGLPDGVITTDDIAAGAVTDAKVNASAAIADSKLTGATCKAWVNFNGDGAVSIRASRNVSSITDNGVGDYTVNFTAAFADTNFAAFANATSSATQSALCEFGDRAITTSSIEVATRNFASNRIDPFEVYVAIFR